jgi:hypothetical protein
VKIVLISTLNHNPGDEIIRLGQEHVLRKVFPDAEFKAVHKHDPRTLFAGFSQRVISPRRLISAQLYKLYAATLGSRDRNYLDEADLVVFAGTPFIWRNQVRFFRATSANAEWVHATWDRLFCQLQGKQVMNLAAGTSVTSRAQIDELFEDRPVLGFLRRAVERTCLTTARDILTKQILDKLGFRVPLIPCSSILSSQGAGLSAQSPEYVVFNVMRAAGPGGRGVSNASNKWRETVSSIVRHIEKNHPVLFVSHSAEDDATTAEWFPHHRRFFSMNPIELLRVYSKALYGICNRVHSGGAIASFGRPVIVIGGDSRVDLIKQFGMPAVDHREIGHAELLAMIEDLESNYGAYVEKLKKVIGSTERAYVDAICATDVFSNRQPTAMAVGQ